MRRLVGAVALAAGMAMVASGCQSRGITAQLQHVRHAVVSANGRVVTVPAAGGGCVRRVALTASETREEVRLRLTAYSISGPGVACTTEFRPLQASTMLAAPLRGRPLVDSASGGRRVPFIPGSDLAQPRWLPVGAHGPATSPWGGWTRTYTFPVGSHLAPLVIVENRSPRPEPAQFSPDAGTVSHLTINGHPGLRLVGREHGQLVQVKLGWHAGGYEMTVESLVIRDGQRALQPAALEHVATSLAVPAA